MIFDPTTCCACAAVQELQGEAPLTLSGEGLWAGVLSSGQCVLECPGSQRNAIFRENEVNGIHVDDAIIQKFEGLDRAAGEELGLEVSVQAAKAAAPYADGFYLMTPFNRVALMERLIAPIMISW